MVSCHRPSAAEKTKICMVQTIEHLELKRRICSFIQSEVFLQSGIQSH